MGITWFAALVGGGDLCNHPTWRVATLTKAPPSWEIALLRKKIERARGNYVYTTMPKINSRAKGQRGERAFRDFMRDHGFLKTERGQQRSGSADSPDVKIPEIPKLHVEVKCVERLNLPDAMDQSIRDAGEGKIPIVAHKKNRTGWLITMRGDDWIELVKESNLVKQP